MIDVLWGGVTDAGSVRAINEDCMLLECPIFAVADGMGGVPAGGQASEMAIAELRRCTGGATTTTEAVLDAVYRANQAIRATAAADPAKQGMGTTLVGLALVEVGDAAQWLAFNVGDSRLYRLAGPAFEQITVDHSEVEELIADGLIGEAERAAHPRAHVITRTLGTAPPPDADCWLLHPVPGERFLLCSDGVTGRLGQEAIKLILGGDGDPEAVAGQLVSAALEAGSDDNVTAVVVHVPGRARSAAIAEADDGATTARRPVRR